LFDIVFEFERYYNLICISVSLQFSLGLHSL
jgi:hypothetical protein